MFHNKKLKVLIKSSAHYNCYCTYCPTFYRKSNENITNCFDSKHLAHKKACSKKLTLRCYCGLVNLCFNKINVTL